MYKIHQWFLSLFLAAACLSACSEALEPGLYQVQAGEESGFLQVSGTDTALFYRNSGLLLADSLQVIVSGSGRSCQLAFPDGRMEKAVLEPYAAPEFRQIPRRDMFRDPVYEVGETRDIIYGRVLRGDDPTDGRVDLLMDLYYPRNDGTDSRPLLVALHGGAFRGGDKRDSSLVEWCRYFASLGYVVSSVNYRLGYRRSVEGTEAMLYRTLKDANAAVRFLLKRDSLMIHPGRIFAAGADAGAVTALNLAFMREENLPEVIREEEDTVVTVHQQLIRGFDVRAVANLWGAVTDTAILHNARIPVISFQSTEDDVIPFGTGYPFEKQKVLEEWDLGFLQSALEAVLSIFVPDLHPFRTMYGSGEIHRILRSRGVQSELHAFEGSRHDLFLKEDGTPDYPLYDEIKEQTAAFFASKMETSPVSLRPDPEDPQLFVIDDSEVSSCFWKVEGGVVLGKSSDTVRILLFPDADGHSVSVSGTYTSGMTFYESVEL